MDKFKFDINKLLDKDFRYKPNIEQIPNIPGFNITIDLGDCLIMKFNNVPGINTNSDHFSTIPPESIAFYKIKHAIDGLGYALKIFDEYDYKIDGYIVRKQEKKSNE